MEKKATKTIKKDQLGILLEDINGKFGQTMEGFSVLTKQMKEGFEEVKKEITDFKEETNSKFETVFNYLSVLEPQGEKIAKLDKRVTIIEKQLVKN
ncbi:MAG: hypothetical protein WC385_00410 [Candidatus Paceibacterota bacterium]|jgi:hypothetical protein